MKTVGERIRDRRIELNMTQEELGKKVGYTSRTTVNKVESGISQLNQKKVVLFANALGVTPAYLMGWETESTEEKTLAKLIDQLTDDEVNELSNFIDYLISKRK